MELLSCYMAAHSATNPKRHVVSISKTHLPQCKRANGADEKHGPKEYNASWPVSQSMIHPVDHASERQPVESDSEHLANRFCAHPTTFYKLPNWQSCQAQSVQ